MMERYPYSHSPTRPRNYYAALKEGARMTPEAREAAALLRYATAPEMHLRIELPKPHIKELTVERSAKIAATTGRVPPPSLAAATRGAAPPYNPRYAWPTPAPT